MAEAPGARQYSPAEVDEILKRALARQQEAGTTREDILAAAREVGLDDASVLAAAAEVESERSATQIAERLRAEKGAAVGRHATTFAVVNLGLFLLNLATNMATVTEGVPRWWFVYPLALWGIALAVQTVRWKLHPEASPEEVREALDAARQAQAREEFEKNIERGVDEVLNRVQTLIQPAPKVRVSPEEPAATDDEAAVEARPSAEHEEER